MATAARPLATDVLSDDDLVRALQAEADSAVSFRNSSLAQEQANAIDFYEAEPFGDEVEGRSQIVTPDVQEVCDYMQISTLRTFVSGDKVVEFDANDESQEDYVEEASVAVSHVFMRHQDGYKVLLDWLQSGLVEKIGIVKSVCVTERKKKRQRVVVDADQLQMLDQSGALVNYADNIDGGFTALIEEEIERKRYKDMPIPSEEFLFSGFTRQEDDAVYIAHRARKTKSALVEMGFDRAQVEDLPTNDGEDWSDVRHYTRWRDEWEDNDRKTLAMQEVLLFEEYIRIDRDGDGIAELLKVFRVKDAILIDAETGEPSIEEVDEQPFTVFCPFPRAHRMVGNSLAEKVMDIQRTRSVLLRNVFDGIYQSNKPRVLLHENAIGTNTIDDLLTNVPGSVIRWKGAIAPGPLADAFDVSKSISLLEFMVGERETRTGITRLNQGLDADTLNKTASGQAQLQAQGQQIEEFVARNFAEAVARMFLKKLRLMKAEGDPIAVKLDGQFKTVDPSLWDDDLGVTINVGLGSGKKETRLVYRRELLDIQKEGLTLGLCGPEQIYRNAAGMVRDAALGTPTDYFIDPETPEGQQAAQQAASRPDPEMAKAQAQAQIQAQKVQGDQQAAQVKLALEQQESEAKMQLMREEAQTKLQLEREKAAAEMALAERQQAFEMQMAERQFALEERKLEKQAELDRVRAEQDHEVKMKKYREGGDLDK